MATMTPQRVLRLYSGPPGDATEYWLPRDEAAWYAAWDVYRRDHPVSHPYPCYSHRCTLPGGHIGDHDPAPEPVDDASVPF